MASVNPRLDFQGAGNFPRERRDKLISPQPGVGEFVVQFNRWIGMDTDGINIPRMRWPNCSIVEDGT